MRAILFGRQTPSCRLHPLGNEIMLTLSSLRFCNQNSPFWFLESTHSAVFIKSCFLCFRWSLELTPLNLKFPTIILLNVHTLYLQSSLEQHRFELHGSPSTYFFFFPNKYSQRFLAAGFASGDSANPGWETVFSHSRSRIPNRGSKILFLIHRGLNLLMRTAGCRVKSYKMSFDCVGMDAPNPGVVFKGQLCTDVT